MEITTANALADHQGRGINGSSNTRAATIEIDKGTIWIDE